MGLGIPFFSKTRRSYMFAALHKPQLVVDCNQESFASTDSIEICILKNSNLFAKNSSIIKPEGNYVLW